VTGAAPLKLLMHKTQKIKERVSMSGKEKEVRETSGAEIAVHWR
jgi:hypothetical protein